jgi:hypothetical protein
MIRWTGKTIAMVLFFWACAIALRTNTLVRGLSFNVV